MHRRHVVTRGAALAIALAVPAAAHAQNASIPGALELYPTVQAIGARLAYAGDDNGNATARLEWRRRGVTVWTPGMAMTRISARRWAGSVLWLDPGADYEVRAVIEDPDGGGAVAGQAWTRSDLVPAPTGRTWWVATTGSDQAAGTEAAPLRTIQAGVSRAQPGDEVRVRPGVYDEAVEPSRAGTATAPIQLLADGPGVVLDGSDPAYRSRSDWRDEGGGVYSVPFTGATRLVSVDSLQRLYRHANVAAIRSAANGIAQGWTLEAGRLWVRLEDGGSPVGHVVHVARHDNGVYLDVDHWVVAGFEVRHYGTGAAGSGIYLRGASRCVISGNNVHTIGGKGIYLRVLAADNLIDGNVCWDPRIGTWPWAATKSHEEEQQGISHRGGRGNVIRGNVVYGTFDGIDVAAGETDENVGADCDVDGNVVHSVSDDALEPETISGINVRVVRNRVHDVFSGLSIAPNYQGPTYVLYNTFTNYRRSGLKFSLSGTGHTWICHNTIASSVAGTPAMHPSGPYSNLHFRNNILVGNGAACVSDDAGESQTGNDFDHDLIHATGGTLFRWKGVNYGTLAALRSGTGFEIHGLAGDPRFAGLAAGDVTLLPGSPAIDAALRLPGINDGFHGAGPDLGASETAILGVDVRPPAVIRDLRAEP